MPFLHRLIVPTVLLAIFCRQSAAQNVRERLPQIEHTPPEPTVLEQLDSVFARAVDAMNTVLFYRLLTTERKYVVYEHAEHYFRKRGSDADFCAPQFVREEPERTVVVGLCLTAESVELAAARGDLVAGDVIDGTQKSYRLGVITGPSDGYTINENGIAMSRDFTQEPLLVEYISLKQDRTDPEITYGAKFVQDPGTKSWHRVMAKRGLISDTDVIPESFVQKLGRIGAWKLAEEPHDPSRPYILTEQVGGIPVVVAWLACGAVFFTVYMGFFNVGGFRHAVDVVRGKYDNPDDEGEVTHFQALASALSATIGLGNIAGVTIAMTLGGPGAFFWMILCGLFGMSSKFVECTLGQKYRHVKPDGTVLGGPMRYLHVGLKEMKLGLLGSFLSIVFAVMCILASFGGGNMIQANQSGAAVLQMLLGSDLQQISELNQQIAAAAKDDDTGQIQRLQQQKQALTSQVGNAERIVKPIFGIALAALVALVIIGGIKRIGKAAEKIVPSMCLIYVAACLFIILSHLDRVPALAASIFTEAFDGTAMGGGILGVLVVGVQRAAFSNEAGAGSAAIAHSAAKTEEPIREGCVALLGPFLDTVVVCSMTALVILITGAWDNSEWVIDQGLAGAALTSKAFESEISWFPYVLSVAVVLFAYSTIISWSYYGEKAWESLFGPRSTPFYKLLAVTAVFVGTVVNLGSVLDFSDMMILGMAFPNIAGVVLLSPQVRRDLKNYWSRYKAGDFKTFK